MNNFNQETSDTGSDKKWAMNKLMNEVLPGLHSTIG